MCMRCFCMVKLAHISTPHRVNERERDWEVEMVHLEHCLVDLDQAIGQRFNLGSMHACMTRHVHAWSSISAVTWHLTHDHDAAADNHIERHHRQDVYRGVLNLVPIVDFDAHSQTSLQCARCSLLSHNSLRAQCTPGCSLSELQWRRSVS